MENQTPHSQPSPAAAQAAPTPAASTPAVAAGAKVKDQGKANKRFVLGCLGAFGCAIFLFIGVLFAFLAFGSENNPIFGFFGVPSGDVTNVLITLVNLIFLGLVFAAFVAVVIGVFKVATARKDDKEGKRKSFMFTFGAFALLMFFVFTWVLAYFFLDSKRTVRAATAIVTDPARTINLTAPASVKFEARNLPINTTQYEILSYAWDFADGTKLNGPRQTHTFTELGNFNVKLAVTTKERAAGTERVFTYSKDVTIQNIQANVRIKADKVKGPFPLTVNLDGSTSTSENGEIRGYAWDLDEDGAFDDSKEPTAKVTFDKEGDYMVRLQVRDSSDALSVGELKIEVTPSDTPTAVIAIEKFEGKLLETNKIYVFTGASSVTPSGTIQKYSWEFGDGTKAVTRTSSHLFKEPGEYDVTLTVTDSSNKVGTVTQRYTVSAAKAAPQISIKTDPVATDGVIEGQAPLTIVFDASATKDPNDDIVDYMWDFTGDNKTDDTNPLTSYTFRQAGTFNISLSVTDSANNVSKSQLVVKVAPAGLKAALTATPIAGTVPLRVTFDASGSSYPEGTIVSYEWNFGDGKPSRVDEAKVTYQYTSIGTFKAKVTAISSDNKRATTEVTINVRPISVKACFTVPSAMGKAPFEVQFDPTCSTGTVVNYRWNFGDLGQSSDRKPIFTFEDPGEYDVSLEVSDTENVVDSFTMKIKVEPSN